MALALRDIQPALAFAARHRSEDVSLAVLAEQTALSPFHLHRAFTAIAGETPKHYTQRLRLEEAAALLLSTDLRVIDVAFACGFQSHEVFTRAFRRIFHATPQRFRQRGRIPPRIARLIHQIGPCIHLYHHQTEPAMPYSIETRQLAEQPILAVRRRVKRSEIAATIGASLGAIFAHAMQHATGTTGHPITRYIEMSPGLVTMEPAMRVASHPPPDPAGNVLNQTLPAGLAATTTHMGPYQALHAAYTALEEWMHDNSYVSAGAPWEDYITDPAEQPDPTNWRTDVYWPIRKAEA
jgi:AraC-like DNA-binding protein/effector-binding domain-containing protein